MSHPSEGKGGGDGKGRDGKGGAGRGNEANRYDRVTDTQRRQMEEDDARRHANLPTGQQYDIIPQGQQRATNSGYDAERSPMEGVYDATSAPLGGTMAVPSTSQAATSSQAARSNYDAANSPLGNAYEGVDARLGGTTQVVAPTHAAASGEVEMQNLSHTGEANVEEESSRSSDTESSSSEHAQEQNQQPKSNKKRWIIGGVVFLATAVASTAAGLLGFRFSKIAAEDDTVDGQVPGPVDVSVLSNDTFNHAPTIVLANADSNGAVTQTGVGKWTVSDSGVHFEPDAAYNYTAPATVAYSIKVTRLGADTVSDPANVTVKFEVPVAMPIQRDKQARDMTITISDLAITKYDLAVTGVNGTWMVDAKKNIVFQPNQTDFDKPATATYTLTYGQAVVNNTITVNFVAVVMPGMTPNPTDITQSNLPHVAKSFPVLTAAQMAAGISAQLVMPPAGWMLDPITSVVTFTPPSGFDFTMPAVAPYQLLQKGIASKMTANIALNFAVYKQPSDLIAHADYNQASVPIPILTLLGLSSGTVHFTNALDSFTVMDPIAGTWTISAARDAITYQPSTSYMTNKTAGGAGLALTLQFDANSSANFNLTVKFNKPIAQNLTSGALPARSAYTFPVAASAMPAAGSMNTIDPASLVITGFAGTMSPPITSLSPTLLASPQGSWAVNAGSIIFTPDASFTTGDPAPIYYQISDDKGNPSSQATLTVTYAV